jgi:hypothetical protein
MQTMAARRRVELVAWDPTVERTDLLVRTGATMLATTFVTALTAAMIGVAQTPLGWILVGGSALLGASPSVVTIGRRRGQTRLPVGGLPTPAAALVAEAADQAKRLSTMAAASPEGPLADHLGHLSATADRYVVTLHATLSQGAALGPQGSTGQRAGTSEGWTPVPGGPDPRTWLIDDELDREARQLVARLTELADAATELRQAQRQHLEPSPLEALTEQTRQLAEAITTDDIHHQPQRH